MLPVKKLNVLVVDDELSIRAELRHVDWAACHAVIVGEADNGEEAYFYCRDYPPDIVITDITMPIMDGMELLKRLKRDFPQIQVILLTCHSDFDYARQALKYGAAGYVPKAMMNTEEISQAIGRCRSIIDIETSHNKTQLEQKRLMCSALLRRKIPDDGAFIERFPTRFCCIYVENSEKDWVFVNHVVSGYMDSLPALTFWFQGNIGEYLLFLNETKERNVENLMGCIVKDATALLSASLPFVSNEMYLHAVIGGLTDCYEEYVAEYHALDRWKEALFFMRSENSVLTGPPPPLSAGDELCFRKWEDRLSDVAFDSKKLEALVRNELYLWAKKQRPHPDALKSFMFKLLKAAEPGMRREFFDEALIRRILHSMRLDQLVDLVLHSLSSSVTERHPYVQLAMRVIDERLEEPISLISIASDAGTTPQYLSRLFVKENGESFVSYLARKRMEKSIKLLKETNLKVYEVAEAVGIPSYRYFSTLFKEWVGATPKEFRSRC